MNEDNNLHQLNKIIKPIIMKNKQKNINMLCLVKEKIKMNSPCKMKKN